ncbi:MAG: sensor histidine kinase N-terminal domain-containing protein [Rhodoferax sp.]|nr:sensor histidine kinase N-terminal domain-containing protein [Rhodoferax sp.]
MTSARRSLQRRLLWLVLGTVVSVWLLATVLTWLDVRHELDELLDGHLAQAAAVLVVQQADDDMGEEGHGVDTPSLHRYAPKVAFQVFHAGRLVLRSANAPTTPMVSVGKTTTPGFDTVHIADHDWRVFSAQGAESDILVYVGEEMRSRTSILWAVLHSTLLPMALALPVLALILWWVIHSGLAPMRQMGHTLVQRKPDALEPLVLDNAPAEIAPMVEALNGLFTRITALLESERRFTTDASHELRTPIAAIRTQAQVALAETDDILRRHALQNTIAGCDRATHLVEQLLTLSRLEASAQPAMTELNLVELTRQVLAEEAAKAIGKGQLLSLEAPQSHDTTMTGNAALLAVLIRNLLDNALRYSPAGARIQVVVEQCDGHVALRVEDSGPGMSEVDCQRLGERFFRVIGSDQDGSGLGWSIVQRIAAVHGLKLHMGRSSELGGLAVRVATGYISLKAH